MDYHFVYKDVEGASTQWDDIQRKLGNLPAQTRPLQAPSVRPRRRSLQRPQSQQWIDDRTEEELEDLEDDPDLDDDRFLEEYRKRRLAEMREAVRVAKFGSVVPIAGSDFVREVSQAPSDVWVVVLLYKIRVQLYKGHHLNTISLVSPSKIPDCAILLQCLEELATKYPETKFVKIISTDCIPNYPDRNVPTILVYNNGAVKDTYVGIHPFGSRKCTPESVALVLCQSNPVLNDGQGGDGKSMKDIQKRFIEKVMTKHLDEDKDDDSD